MAGGNNIIYTLILLVDSVTQYSETPPERFHQISTFLSHHNLRWNSNSLKLNLEYKVKSRVNNLIFTAGALVLPEGTLGIMEQSTTCRLLTPYTRSAGSTTAVGSPIGPISAVPVG